MKLIHTSDWHLGMGVGTGSLESDQRFFLEQLYDGKIKCAKCGETIYSRYSVAFKDNGAIVLCDECFPWKKNGETEVGDLVFQHKSR